MGNELAFMVTITALSGQENLLKRKLLLVSEALKQAPGCLHYELNQDKVSPGVFIVLERWDTRDNWVNLTKIKEFEVFLNEKSQYVSDFEIKELQRISFSS